MSVLAYPGLSWFGLSVGSVWSQMVADSLGWSVSVDIEHLRCSKHFTHFSCFLSLCLIPWSQWKFRLWSKQAFLKTASLFKVSVSTVSFVCLFLTVCLSACLLLSVWLVSGENVPGARGLCMWSLWRPAKKHCLKSGFIRARPLHYSQGQRCTSWIGEQWEGQDGARCANPDCEDKRITSRKATHQCRYWNNTTSRSCCCQKICSRGIDCRSGKVPHVPHVPRGSTEDILHYFTFSHHFQGSIVLGNIDTGVPRKTFFI